MNQEFKNKIKVKRKELLQKKVEKSPIYKSMDSNKSNKNKRRNSKQDHYKL